MTDNNYLTVEAERLMEQLTPPLREKARSYIVELAKKQEEESKKPKSRLVRFLCGIGDDFATYGLMFVWIMSMAVAIVTLFVYLSIIFYNIMLGGGLLNSIAVYLAGICASSGDCFFPRLYTAFMLAMAIMVFMSFFIALIFIRGEKMDDEVFSDL